MKKQFISAALIAVLITMAVSCQKENVMDLASGTTVSETGTVCTVQYAVDGALHSTVISSDNDWDAFMQTVFALSRNGYEVRIMDEKRPAYGFSTKETRVYTTTHESSASTWSKDKVYNGYKVTVVYSPNTGEYTCIATR